MEHPKREGVFMLPKPLLGDDAPWKQRFRAGRLFMAKVARKKPSRGLVAFNGNGTCELYRWDVPSGQLSQLTHRPHGTAHGWISSDAKWVYYLHDTDGNMMGHYHRLPYGGGEAVDLTPNLPDYPMSDLALNDDGTLAAFTAATANGFEYYLLRLSPNGTIADPWLIHTSPTMSVGPVLSPGGEMAVWMVARQGALAFGLQAFDCLTGEKLAELWDGPGSVMATAFSPVPADFRILAKSDASGLTRPFLWNPWTGHRQPIADGRVEGELAPWDWTPDGRSIVLCQTIRARQKLWQSNLETENLKRIDHPDGTIQPVGFLTDGRLAIRFEESTRPRSVIALGTREPVVLLDPTRHAEGRPWRSFTCTSTGGVEVQGWVATPEGDGPFPTIFETHGGPTFAMMNSYSPSSQMWLDHGFAFCSLNYRGSTTFGRDFERAIWGNLGECEVEDMVAAREWLINNKIAKPDAILLTGWSYGGYLTLHAMGLHPELWAGGMGGVVVADWVSQYEDENDELRGYDVALFGGTLDEKREQYVKSSPITYVDRLQAPLLIIQGRNDTTDPPRQVELYEAKARELGKHVEVEWYETGHSGSSMNQELAIRHGERMLAFAYEALAGKM